MNIMGINTLIRNLKDWKLCKVDISIIFVILYNFGDIN